MAWTLARLGALGALVLAGCQVRGIVGSDVAAGTGGDGDGDGAGDDADVDGGDDADGDGDGSHGDDADGAGDDDGAGETAGDDDSDESGSPVVFDVGDPDAPHVCGAPLAVTCDHRDDDPWHAVGLDCDDGFAATVVYSGHPSSLYVHEGPLGTAGVFEPREGGKMLVLSSGDASLLPLSPDELTIELGCDPLVCPSDALVPEPVFSLPPPVDVRRVSEDGRTCADDFTLVGTGDCSNTLQQQWEAGSGAYDYAEMRVTTTVPEHTDAFRYQFAFFSIEYPLFADHASPWNDMYIAWLESESWTGNVSFDEMGNPITINGVFLDYRDAPTEECPDCNAPELAGFAAEGHAGTQWLETTAPVTAGESIELLLAVMDLSDGVFDTMVILDGFEWTCSDLPPITTPAG